MNYVEYELKHMRSRTKHFGSRDLPYFLSENQREWTEILEEYNGPYYNNDKNDTIRPNIGWKLHLNVAPANCRDVSDVLISGQYTHKFLSGGECEEGKIFTVYTGSKRKTEQIGYELSKRLVQWLAQPINHCEIEFSKGVVGRFCAPSVRYYRGGPLGFDLLREALGDIFKIREITPERWEEIARTSFISLKQEFGNYFW